MSAAQRAENRLGAFLRHVEVAPTAATSSDELAAVAGIQNGVALIVINNPPVNSFSPAVAQSLAKAYKQCIDNSEVKAIVITGAGKTFMAGADIPHLQKLTKEQNRANVKSFLREAHDLANLIESGPKPVVAAVNGDALGGGCELAMACNARVAIAKAKFGLPELKLGVIPGLGGTQRLPRLIGVQNAVTAILSSKNIPAPKAMKDGLVDLVVKKPSDLVMAAGQLALAIASGSKPRKISLNESSKLVSKEEIAVIIGGARVQTAKKTKNVVHPFKALDAIEVGLLQGGAQGIEKEMDAFADCLDGPAARALLHFFLASRATTKIPGVNLKEAKPVKSVAILGGGTMGAGIAICFLMKNIPVILKEVNQKFLEAGVERILNDIQAVVKARKMNPMVIEYLMRGLKPQLTYDGFDKVDLVIEAVIEDIPLKQKIFSELEKACSSSCILASNTSTINIDTITANLQSSTRSRVLGLHFFSPAHIMPLLEIVRTSSTSSTVLATSVVLAKTIGKTPVVVGNCVGFVANRVFFPYGMAGGLLIQGGLSPYQIDKALMAFGMPMGIFRMNDSVGVDIGTHIAPIFTKAYPERVYNNSLAKLMVEKGRLGQKSGSGFYLYKVPRKPTEDEKGIADVVKAVREESKGSIVDTSKLSPQEIVEICMYPIINECARTLSEGFANSASDVDVVSVMGYGFPAYRGGLLHWAKEVGFDKIAARLEHYAKTFGAKNKQLEGFFKPSDALLKLAQK